MGTIRSSGMEILEPRTFLAAQLVDDLNTTTPKTFDALVALNGAIFATSGDADDTPAALWRRDPSGEKYTLVHSASDTQKFQNVTAVGDELYYVVDDAIWRTGGTPETTQRVIGLSHRAFAAYATGTPDEFTRFGRFVYFRRENALFRTDGTVAGTKLIKDVAARSLARYQDRIFFSASGRLWSTDGSRDGTRREDELRGNISVGDELAVVGDSLFMSGSFNSPFPNTLRKQLFRTEGQSAATLVHNGSDDPFDFAALGQHLYFLTRSRGSLISDGRNQLWRTDGTTEGTQRLEFDFDDPDFKTKGSVEDIVPARKQLYLVIDASNAFTNSLWRIDAAADRERLLLDDYRPRSSFIFAADPPAALATSGNSLWFVSNDRVWSSDGTKAGTVEDSAIPQGLTDSGMTNLGTAGSYTYFSIRDLEDGWQVWRSNVNGASDDLELYFDFYTGPIATDTGFARSMYTIGGDQYFFVNNRVWVSDDGAAPVILPPTKCDFAIGDSGGRMIFVVHETGIGYALWATDGTAGGTRKLTTFLYNFQPGVKLGGYLYFIGRNNSTGDELWRTDGTPAGTTRITDLDGKSGDNLAHLTSWNGELVFTGAGRDGMNRVWRSDGTAAGTRSLVKVSGARGFHASEDNLYFRTDSNIWWTDGASSNRLRSIPGFAEILGVSNGVAILKVQRHEVHAAVVGQPIDVDLWRTDGSEAGTFLLRDVPPQPATRPAIAQLLADNDPSPDGLLYFICADARHGKEIWSTDGTIAGTKVIADIWPGAAGSDPRRGVLNGSSIVFLARDPDHGLELRRLAIT